MPEFPRISGQVIPGDKVGRTLGFPTANLKISQDLTQLEPGVYTSWCWLDEDATPIHGLAYYGPRLIFNELTNSFEVYLYDFNQEIYGQNLKVELLSFVRAPLPFTTLADLQTQLEADKAAGIKLFKTHTQPLQ